MGYYFGQVPFIKENFTGLVMGIIFISLAPLFVRFFQNLMKKWKMAYGFSQMRARPAVTGSGGFLKHMEPR